MANAPTLAMRLRSDVRLFGDILGRVLKTEEGEAVFEAIEQIRQASVAYHRDGAPERGLKLDSLLQALSLPDALRFAHSFVCFSQLINIAEDQEDRRRLRAGARSDRSLAGAVERLKAEGVDAAAIEARLRQALVMPVITAHPSEVRRKSVIDRVSRIAETFDAHDRAPAAARAPIEAELARQILILWATRQLRPTSLGVADEIENAVSFFQRTFLSELPRVYADLDAALGGGGPTPSFLRVGSWVGGDRDGNPNVTAGTLRLAFLTQSRLIVSHYLEEVHALGAALALSTQHVEVTPELADLADRSRGLGVCALDVGLALRGGCGLQIGVGDDRDRVLEVIEDDERVGEHQRHVRQLQGIRAGGIAERLHRAHQVIAEEADRATDEWRPNRPSPRARAGASR